MVLVDGKLSLEFWQWLQSSEGAIAGGATNSWKGAYEDPSEDGITGYFYGLAYDWQPVYHCPPSNNWFGMQVWSMERLAEYYYVTDDGVAANILKNWITWFENDIVTNIFLDVYFLFVFVCFFFSSYMALPALSLNQSIIFIDVCKNPYHPSRSIFTNTSSLTVVPRYQTHHVDVFDA